MEVESSGTICAPDYSPPAARAQTHCACVCPQDDQQPDSQPCVPYARGALLDKTPVLAHNTNRTRIAVETKAVAREVSQCASGATVYVVLLGEWPTRSSFNVTDGDIPAYQADEVLLVFLHHLN